MRASRQGSRRARRRPDRLARVAARMRLRTRKVAVVVAVVVLVAAAAGAVAFVQLRGGATAGRRARAAALRRGDARRPGSTTPTPAPFAFASAAGSRSSTATGTAGPTCTSPAASGPAALYRNDSPVGGALRFTRGARSGDRPDRGERRLPDRHRRRRAGRPGGPPGRRERACCAASATAGSSAANERWSFDGGTGFATAFSATWEGAADVADPGVRRLRSTRRRTGTRPPLRRERARPTGRRRGPATAPPIPLTPGWCALSMLFSDWDRSGRRDLRVSNDRHYYDRGDGQEQLWRIAPAEPPRLYTAADGWVPVQV